MQSATLSILFLTSLASPSNQTAHTRTLEHGQAAGVREGEFVFQRRKRAKK